MDEGDAMDEGLVGLIGGGLGLVGTFAATAGAMWGARLGAMKGLEATRAQVAGQELAEHRHWAREQRRLALTDALDELTIIDQVLRKAWVKLLLGDSPPTQLHEDYMTHHEAFMRDVFHLGVWGPDEARMVGQNIVGLANRVYEAWALWESALNAGDPTDVHQEAFRVGRSNLNAPWTELLNLTAQTLRDPVP
jgi:hypothetical protein